MQKYKISEIENTPLGSRVAPFVDFLKENDLGTVPTGKYPLSGGVSVAVMEIVTKTEEKWEAHKNFIDIQIIISGEERMGFGNVSKMPETVSYNPQKDVFFVDGKGGSYINVSAGEFVIFGVEDAHAPGLAVGENPVAVKKAVVKIPV